MLHWTIWGREPGVHEASLRRYESKLVYHITVYFLFALVTVTCKYSILTQAFYNSCSYCQPPTSMQAWHRRTRFCRILTDIPGVFWITDFTDSIEDAPLNRLRYRTWGPWSQLFKTHQGYLSWCGRSLQWGWWPSIWATVVRCKMVR